MRHACGLAASSRVCWRFSISRRAQLQLEVAQSPSRHRQSRSEKPASVTRLRSHLCVPSQVTHSRHALRRCILTVSGARQLVWKASCRAERPVRACAPRACSAHIFYSRVLSAACYSQAPCALRLCAWTHALPLSVVGVSHPLQSSSNEGLCVTGAPCAGTHPAAAVCEVGRDAAV